MSKDFQIAQRYTMIDDIIDRMHNRKNIYIHRYMHYNFRMFVI